MGAVAKMDGGDCRIDLRLDGNAGDGSDTPEGVEAHWYGFALGDSGFDRHRWGLGLPGCDPVCGPEPAHKHGNADQGKSSPTNEPFSLDHR
jgi:hypothetical protein